MHFREIPIDTIATARSGSSTALEELCRLVQEPAYAMLVSLLRNHEDAADVLQECLIRLCRFLHQLDDPANFAPWYCRMLVNRANSWRTKTARVVSMDPATMQHGMDSGNSTGMFTNHAANPRDTVAGRERISSLEKTLESLPAQQKTAITLYEIEGFKISEIAEIMELSTGTVKFHLHQARERLRNAVDIPMALSQTGGTKHD